MSERTARPSGRSRARGRGRAGARARSAWRGSLGFWCLIAVAILIVAYLQVIDASRPHVSGDRLRVDGFVSLAEHGRIRNATILDQDAYVVGEYERRDGTVARYNLPYIKSAANSRERLVDIVVGNRIPSNVDQQFAKTLVGPATLLLPALIFVVIFLYFLLSWRRGTGLFGIRSGARVVEGDEGTVTFDDVAGQRSAVTELREVADYLTDPRRFTEVGAAIPKGILLFGPPGCGKTLLARALAGEAGAAFYSISGSDFVELYVGVGAARVRELFREARASAPAIVFIDELDAVGRRRIGGVGGAATGSVEEQNQALNQLLSEIDGFSASEGVIVVGATNRPDVLDPALLRPGRFDRAVGLELPDEQGRLAILRVHAGDKAMGADADLEPIASRAVGMTGADLASLLNEAALQAARAGRSAISAAHLDGALERIREAPERQRRLAIRDRRVGQALLAHERVTFADVAGLDEAVEELAEVRDYLADPAHFERLGARFPSGYLLVGPPGVGKTLLARAVAGEANAAFVSAAATEFVELHLGEGAARLRDLFAEARSTAPSIVFIDELDAIGALRGAMHPEARQTQNQLLIELDGLSRREGVIVMAASNREDMLDPALVRPGRFDRRIALDYPDRDARRAILDVHVRGKRLAANVDLDAVARLTRGMAGGELASIMNESALLAARRGLEEIPMAIVEEALERVGAGIGARRLVSDEERRRIAYHEAGHGLVARALPGGTVLHKLSIVPRGRVLGATWLPESDDRVIHSRSLLIERMAMLLGGRVAERMVFGEVGDGAANDLARVAEMARRMVSALGMSDAVGAMNYADAQVANGTPPYSDETARLLDSEARKLVSEAERLARGVLDGSRGALDRVAETLLERETLTLEEVEEIVAAPPPAPAGAG